MRRHPRAQRLQVILNLAEREEEKRLAVWGELQQKLQSEEEQRDQLEAYNSEYQRKISSPSTEAIRAGDIHATLGFMQQIKGVLQGQKEKIVLLQSQAETAKKAYLEQRGKAQALHKLMDKLDKEFDAEEEKDQQKQADEWSNRIASQRMNK